MKIVIDGQPSTCGDASWFAVWLDDGKHVIKLLDFPRNFNGMHKIALSDAKHLGALESASVTYEREQETLRRYIDTGQWKKAS